MSASVNPMDACSAPLRQRRLRLVSLGLIRAALFSLLLVLFIGCASQPQRPPQQWAGLRMDGLSLDLVDPENIEQLWFTGDGSVDVTAGQRHGYLAAPAYSWRVRGEWLVIGGHDQGFTQRFRAVHVGKRTITVADPAGQTSVYEYFNKT
jgi:hypothetical protein